MPRTAYSLGLWGRCREPPERANWLILAFSPCFWIVTEVISGRKGVCFIPDLLFSILMRDRQSRRERSQALVFVRYFFNRWIRITCKLSNINQKVKENIPLHFFQPTIRKLFSLRIGLGRVR
jgi:hypothetical protein